MKVWYLILRVCFSDPCVELVAAGPPYHEEIACFAAAVDRARSGYYGDMTRARARGPFAPLDGERLNTPIEGFAAFLCIERELD
jgi:hypothetical protein